MLVHSILIHLMNKVLLKLKTREARIELVEEKESWNLSVRLTLMMKLLFQSISQFVLPEYTIVWCLWYKKFLYLLELTDKFNQ